MTDHSSYDFIVRGGAPLSRLAWIYGVEADAEELGLSAGALLERVFGQAIRIGDRAAWGPVDLVVHSLSDAGSVETVGLALEPARTAA